MTSTTSKSILITGAAGAIGSMLRERLRHRYGLVRLADIAAQAPARAGEEVVNVDMRDLAAVERAMQGMDCVVHLAGIPEEDSWEAIRSANIDGTYCVFEAARRQKLSRVVFASSNHVVGFHRREHVLETDALPRPDTRYGVSKAFGEALGRLYADKYGLSVACLRIGTFRTPDRPSEPRQLLTWISHRDMAQLVSRCIDHPAFHFVIAYGVSNNTRSRWRNTGADLLQYRPEDDSERFAEQVLAAGIAEGEIARAFHGGSYCPIEFEGTLENIV